MLSRTERLLAEHIGAQQGFELVVLDGAETLALSSSLVSGVISIESDGEGRFLVGVDLPLVSSALRKEFSTNGISAIAEDENQLYKLLGRAFQLCGSLPDAPLRSFQIATSNLPKDTEVERLVVQRIGQDIFRTALERYWKHRCPITGIEESALLRASHIKPWAVSNDVERLDVHNGILLAAHLDAAFDKHLMTILADGTVAFSARLSLEALAVLNPSNTSLSIPVSPLHQPYLDQHRSCFVELESR